MHTFIRKPMLTKNIKSFTFCCKLLWLATLLLVLPSSYDDIRGSKIEAVNGIQLHHSRLGRSQQKRQSHRAHAQSSLQTATQRLTSLLDEQQSNNTESGSEFLMYRDSNSDTTARSADAALLQEHAELQANATLTAALNSTSLVQLGQLLKAQARTNASASVGAGTGAAASVSTKAKQKELLALMTAGLVIATAITCVRYVSRWIYAYYQSLQTTDQRIGISAIHKFYLDSAQRFGIVMEGEMLQYQNQVKEWRSEYKNIIREMVEQPLYLAGEQDSPSTMEQSNTAGNLKSKAVNDMEVPVHPLDAALFQYNQELEVDANCLFHYNPKMEAERTSIDGILLSYAH